MTSPDASPSVRMLFDQAIDLPPQEREAWLARIAAAHPEHLTELRALLALDQGWSDRTLSERGAHPVGAALHSLSASAFAGQRVGPFQLVEEIGRGGMGLVFRAARVDGAVEQEVAIKFIRRDFLDEASRRRFQVERQTLATLVHPNIARFHDAAQLPDGTPYFVMEFVEGLPLQAYCKQRKPGLRARLHLFRRICAAVAHAHHHLIVHRDLKPGNLLVTADGTPKLLDFGIAKPLRAGDAANEPTADGQRWFSPRYAAPEQLLGQAVGVGCDIYALGLVLFELLVPGGEAFDFADASPGQVERIITTSPPAAPSSAAAGRGQHELAKRLRRDLDYVVLRCLRKEAAERYATVEQLDADIGNFLRGRPVEARGGERWYRMRKFVQRNAWLVGATAAVVATLVGGLWAFAWQASVAHERAQQLELVSRFQAQMLAQLDSGTMGRDLGARVLEQWQAGATRAQVAVDGRENRQAQFAHEWALVDATEVSRALLDTTVLRPAVRAIEQQFASEPAMAATLHQVVGEQYLALGMLKPASVQLVAALELRQQHLGDRHPDTRASSNALAELWLACGDLVGADWLLSALAAERALDTSPRDAAVLRVFHNLSALRFQQGRHAEALDLARRVGKARAALLGADHPDTQRTATLAADALQALDRLEEAEQAYSEVYRARRRAQGAVHPETLVAEERLATIEQRRDQWDTAAAHWRKVVDGREALLGANHAESAMAKHNLAVVLQALGRTAEAEPLFRQALEVEQRLLGPDHPRTAQSRDALAGLARGDGRPAEAGGKTLAPGLQ